MNDLPACLSISKSLLFIDDTKIYNIATNPQDRAALQNDLDLTTHGVRNGICISILPKVFISVLMQKSALNAE